MIKRVISWITMSLIILSVPTLTLLPVGAHEIGDDESSLTEITDVGSEDEDLNAIGAQNIINGYSRENGRNYYYRNGVRVEQNWYQSGRYRTTYDRAQWLYALMQYSGKDPHCSVSSEDVIFETAKQRGIISSYSSSDYTAAVTRLYVAQTMVKALEYPLRSVGTVRDTNDTSLLTIAYYGYFIPDNNDRLYPNAAVTDKEFDMLISELRLYQKLKGKKMTAFGDSIMYGYGNPVNSTTFEGIADMIGTKYGMNYKKYARAGDVIGKTSDRGHIADQVRSAINSGRKSDLILLNGGINDTWNTDIALGNITSGYDMSSIGESNFTNGFEKTMWLIKNQWGDTPVIYIRYHKMDLGSAARRKSFGERALALCQKWGAAGIDMYNESELDGTVLNISLRYIWDDDDEDRGIHPNALGYAKFYLPPISENIAAQFELSFVGDCNGDGEIDVMDVYDLQCLAAGMPVDTDDTTMMGGDVDRNNKLNIIDATYIQHGIAGLDITPYAIGEVI